MIATIQELSVRPPDVTLMTAFAAGTAASLGLCAIVRLPVVLAYVMGVANSKRHGVVLSILFAVGFMAGTVLLGVVAAPTEGGFRGILYANRYLLWGLGLTLFFAGVLVSGLINPHLLPAKWQRVAEKLGKAGSPGALLLGCALGLLQTPACPHDGTALQTLVQVGAGGSPPGGILPLVAFGAGQGVMMLSVGVLISLVMPNLLLQLRARLCSLEHRIQLLVGNVLMVLGIYFVIIS